MAKKEETVDEAYERKYGRKVTKPKKKPKKEKKDWKSRAMDAFTNLIPGGKKIEKATKDRSGDKSMREKHFPKGDEEK